MSTIHSSHFISAAASGNDWREAAKTILEGVTEHKPSQNGFNLGFLYISDSLSDDAQSILNLFKSVLNIEQWVGGIGIGICANGQSFIDQPAISVMLGKFEDDDFKVFPPFSTDSIDAQNSLKSWLENHDPMLIYVNGDPLSDQDPEQTLKTLDMTCNGFTVGGLTSSRETHSQFANDVYDDGVSGVAFDQNIKVATTLSQGCTRIGETHTITRCDGHDVIALDGEKTVEVFEDDLRQMVKSKYDLDPDAVQVDESALDNPEDVPDEFKGLMKGEVHVAFPISEFDGNDYLVRNILGIDPDTGAMSVSQHVNKGDRLVFVHRDHKSVSSDLSTKLLELRKRVQSQEGEFAPKGALYVSCVARAFNEFQGEYENEMALIRDIIGDVPLTGFYAGGEINKGRLYGYTGILTLFL